MKTAASGFHKTDQQGAIARERAEDDFRKESTILEYERAERERFNDEKNRISQVAGTSQPRNQDLDSNEPVPMDGVNDLKAQSVLPDHTTSVLHPHSSFPSQAFHSATYRPFPREQDDPSQTIIIHPGSRFLRIGRANDSLPVSVRNCIYRRFEVDKEGKKVYNGWGRKKGGEHIEEGKGKGKGKEMADEMNEETRSGGQGSTPNGEKLDREGSSAVKDKEEQLSSKVEPSKVHKNLLEPSTSTILPDHEAILTECIDDARKALRDRMRYNKLKLPPGKAEVPVNMAIRYNSASVGQEIPRLSDPYGVEWLEEWNEDKLFPSAVSVEMWLLGVECSLADLVFCNSDFRNVAIRYRICTFQKKHPTNFDTLSSTEHSTWMNMILLIQRYCFQTFRISWKTH